MAAAREVQAIEGSIDVCSQRAIAIDRFGREEAARCECDSLEVNGQRAFKLVLDRLLRFLQSQSGVGGIGLQVGNVALESGDSLSLVRSLSGGGVGLGLGLRGHSLALIEPLFELLDFLIAALKRLIHLLDLLLLRLNSLLQFTELS